MTTDPEQRLARMEELLNLLDALRPDLPTDELSMMALGGLCEANGYPAGSLWLTDGERYRRVVTLGQEAEREDARHATLDRQAFARLLQRGRQLGGHYLLSWPLPPETPPALRAPGGAGHTLIVPLAFTEPVGFAALESPATEAEPEQLEFISRFADRIAVALGTARIVHEHVRTIDELNRLNEDQRRLRETILALSAPLLPLLPGVLVLPLVGWIDTGRAGRILEEELNAIVEHQAEVVLLDITGVPLVDTSVAMQLVRMAEAARLLGCQTVLVGVRAEIAQTMVGMGVELHGIRTRATLADGLEEVLRVVNRRIVTLPDANHRAP